MEVIHLECFGFLFCFFFYWDAARLMSSARTVDRFAWTASSVALFARSVPISASLVSRAIAASFDTRVTPAFFIRRTTAAIVKVVSFDMI